MPSGCWVCPWPEPWVLTVDPEFVTPHVRWPTQSSLSNGTLFLPHSTTGTNLPQTQHTLPRRAPAQDDKHRRGWWGRSPGELPLSDGRRRGRGGHFPGKLPSSGGGTRAPLTTSPTGSGGADAGPPVTSFCPKGVGDCDVELSRGLFATKIFLPFLCLFVLMQKVL
jgi:hypothetical protein